MSTTAENIQRQISENPILIYMKGSPQLPQCGFSAQTIRNIYGQTEAKTRYYKLA